MSTNKIRITGLENNDLSSLTRIQGALTLNPSDFIESNAVNTSLSFMVRITFHSTADYDAFTTEGITTGEIFIALAAAWKQGRGVVHYVDGQKHSVEEIETTLIMCELVTIIKNLPLHKSDEPTHYSTMSTSLTMGFGDLISQHHDNSIVPVITSRIIPQYMHAALEYDYPKQSGGIAATVSAGICIRCPPRGKCPPVIRPLNLENLVYHHGIVHDLKAMNDPDVGSIEDVTHLASPAKRQKRMMESSSPTTVTKRIRDRIGGAVTGMLTWKK